MEIVNIEETKFEKVLYVILKENVDFRITFGMQGNFGDKKDYAGKIVFNFSCILPDEFFRQAGIIPIELISAESGDVDAKGRLIEKISKFCQEHYRLKIIAFEYSQSTINVMKEGWKISLPDEYLWIDKKMGDTILMMKTKNEQKNNSKF